MRYSFYLFDADDTLFDFELGERCALTATLHEFAICDETAYDEQIKRYIEVNLALWREFEQGKIDQATLRIERFRRWLPAGMDAVAIAVRYLEHLGQQSQMMPGALETVSHIAQHAPIAIVTNGITEVQTNRLAGSPLAPYVKALVISEAIGHPKPHPAMFEAAIGAIGGHKETTLMVGDGQDTDIKGALGFGIHACFYNPHHKPIVNEPTFEIHKLTELIERERTA